MSIDLGHVKKWLQSFEFQKIFIEELGWSNPRRGLNPATFTARGVEVTRRPIAELGGFVVFEAEATDGAIPDARVREAAHKSTGGHHHEHVLVFVDRARRKSVWSWILRKDGRDHPRTHYYFHGQPGDLFIGKLDALMFDLSEFDAEGNASVVEVSRRVRKALDVAKVTKKFFNDFQKQHAVFLELVQGIPDAHDRRWYVSVLLNRLMFIYFLQKKGFLDRERGDYLQERLAWSRTKLGEDRYFKSFLTLLFFEGFAKPEEHRSKAARACLGHIRYLNGGLFLPHRIEQKNEELAIPDVAFEGLFTLFDSYTWHLDDTPGGNDSAINPDVLGYIFEKYINQKSFGAYYTRPEITDWLCEQTIHRVVLDRINLPESLSTNDGSKARFEDLADLLLHLTPDLCRQLLTRVFPSISLLDPACGSGAFLVAALKAMHSLYGSVAGAAEVSADDSLKAIVASWKREHPSLGYFLKKKIIAENLYGVDLMEEATEIARLRLFLALVSSATTEADLEPLPNIDFNIMPGNSLVGLLQVDDDAFKRQSQQDLFTPSYRKLVEKKNRLIRIYRDATIYDGENLVKRRDEIESHNQAARVHLDAILRDKFIEQGAQFEQPTWDNKKNDVGKSTKRKLAVKDIHDLHPFHWGYEFYEVMHDRGGFDAILANPPWEVFEPDDRHFISRHMNIGLMRDVAPEEFHAKRVEFLSNKSNQKAYVDYLAQYPLSSAWFRSAPEYEHQRSTVDGRRAGGKINLYKLFVERCYRLLRPGGHFGLVLPGGIYSDVGAKALREMLFKHCELRALYGFSNERYLFEGVDHRFKICLLVGGRGGSTGIFEAAFRINPREAIDIEHIAEFLRDHTSHIELTAELVAATSPDSLSITEFHDRVDVDLCKKLQAAPVLGEERADVWNIQFAQGDINLTSDRELFEVTTQTDRPPLYEGKMIHQFEPRFAQPRYRILWDKAEPILRAARARRAKDAFKLAERSPDDVKMASLSLEVSTYRLAFRDVARNTDERSMICAMLPPNVVAGHTLVLHRPWRDIIEKDEHKEVPSLSALELFYVAAVFNSFVIDWFLRQRISAHVSMFHVYQLPVPRLTEADPRLAPVATRAAKLTCITPEFDALAKAAGLKSHRGGVTDPEKRAQLRAEIDGLVAHLYGLTEEEFAHILLTFPVVTEPVREAARNAYRAVARGDVL